jgi:hypothetical protein
MIKRRLAGSSKFRSSGRLNHLGKPTDSKVSYFGNLATIFGAIAAVAVPGYIYMDAKISSIVSDKVKVYEAIFTAQSLLSSDYPDKAASEIKIIFGDFRDKIIANKSEFSTGANSAILDLYLVAIADSSEPLDYERDFNAIVEALDKRLVRRYSWHENTIGYYYLRTGDIEKSSRHFDSAKSMAIHEEHPGEYIRASRGKIILAAATNNNAAATDEIISANNLLQDNRILDVAADLAYDFKFKYGRNMSLRYGSVVQNIKVISDYAKSKPCLYG